MGARAAETINGRMDRLNNTITSMAATVSELAEIVRELQSHQTKETVSELAELVRELQSHKPKKHLHNDECGAGRHSKGAVPAAKDSGRQLQVTRRRRDGEPKD